MRDDEDERVADGAAVARGGLPDWPRLMPLRYACAYFGVCDRTFRTLGIEPRRIGRRVLWDRRDLDGYADGMSGRVVRKRDVDAQARSMERRLSERLNSDETSTGRRR